MSQRPGHSACLTVLVGAECRATGTAGTDCRSVHGLVMLPVATGFHFLASRAGVVIVKRVALGHRRRGHQAGDVGNVTKKGKRLGDGQRSVNTAKSTWPICAESGAPASRLHSLTRGVGAAGGMPGHHQTKYFSSSATRAVSVKSTRAKRLARLRCNGVWGRWSVGGAYGTKNITKEGGGLI